MSSDLGRRHLLQAGAALGGGLVGWSARDLTHDRGAEPADAAPGPAYGGEREPFHGRHQSGIVTPPQAHALVLGLDLRSGVDRAGLARMMRLLSDDVARLSQGRPALADTLGELAVLPARLTATFGFGPRVVAELVPPRHRFDFAELPDFATDRLRPQWGQTDLVVQLCADDPVTLAHTRRVLLRDARAFARVRWTQEGFRRARGAEPAGTTMRNLMGQVDGTVNLSERDRDHDRLLWSDLPGLGGGTFLVLRRIAMDLVDWESLSRSTREHTIGRRLSDGAPLTGGAEHDAPDPHAVDDRGLPVLDRAAHVLRAQPQKPDERFLRRPYNYTRDEADPALAPDGVEAGLLFVAFAADPVAQFVPVQQRLAEQDRLNEWVTTIGSGVWAVPGGCSPEDGDYVGRELLGTPAL